MPAKSFAPAFRVSVNGAALAADVSKNVEQVSVVNELDSADQFSLTLANPYPSMRWTHTSDADLFAIRSIARGVTEAIMHRAGGLFNVFSGRVDQQVFISVLVYQPGRSNTGDDLRQHLSNTLNDFSLTATTGWGCPEPVGGAQ